MLPLEDPPYIAITSTLSGGGGTVTFNVPDVTRTDTDETNPVEFWLKVMPTATETDPD